MLPLREKTTFYHCRNTSTARSSSTTSTSSARQYEPGASGPSGSTSSSSGSTCRRCSSPVLPAPPAPLPVPPAPPAFALGPGRSHAILNFDDPNPAQRPRSYTTKRSLPSRPSSMEKQTTWQSSWPAYVTGHGASTGTGSLPCLSTMAQQGTCSLITAKYPWTTPGHTRPPT